MTPALPDKTITLESLREMFASIAAETDWDLSRPMPWGHFFTHSSPESLDRRNDEFYRVAREAGLAAYDGMDVGPVPT